MTTASLALAIALLAERVTAIEDQHRVMRCAVLPAVLPVFTDAD